MADKELTTEEEIMSSIGEGTETETNDDDDQGTGDGEQGTSTSTKPIKEETSGTGKKLADKPNDKGTQVGADGKPIVKQAAGPQDLVGSDGKVIARGGAERRFYEEGQKYKRDVATLTTQVATLNTKLQAYEASNNVGKEYQLSPAEVVSGAQIMAAWKKSPGDTLKYLLTQAQAQGINVEGITTGGVSPDVIKQMVDAAIAPLLQDHQVVQQQNEITQAATQEYNEFTSKFPDAVIHQNHIAALMEKDPNITPVEAYYKLKVFYTQHQLDWSKPLNVHQEEATRLSKGGNEKTNHTLPNGITVNNNDLDDSDDAVGSGTSFEDIIRSSMRQAGMKV